MENSQNNIQQQEPVGIPNIEISEARPSNSKKRTALLWAPLFIAIVWLVGQIVPRILTLVLPTDDYTASSGAPVVLGTLINFVISGLLLGLTIATWVTQHIYIRKEIRKGRLLLMNLLLLVGAVLIIVAGALIALALGITNQTISGDSALAGVLGVPLVLSIASVVFVLFCLSIFNSVYIATNGASKALRTIGLVLYVLAWPFIFFLGFVSFLFTSIFLNPPNEG